MYVSRGDVVLLAVHPDYISEFKRVRPAVAIRRNPDDTVTFIFTSSKTNRPSPHDTILHSEETGLNGDSRVWGAHYVVSDRAVISVFKRLPEEKVKEIVDKF